MRRADGQRVSLKIGQTASVQMAEGSTERVMVRGGWVDKATSHLVYNDPDGCFQVHAQALTD